MPSRRAILAAATASALRTSTLSAAKLASPLHHAVLALPNLESIVRQWPQWEKALPIGSLIKPFTALAYAQRNQFRFPTVTCRGRASGCWSHQPHGALGLADALAFSCNPYFRFLAEKLDDEAMPATVAAYGLPLPVGPSTPDLRIGFGPEWQFRPPQLLAAFAKLFTQKTQPGIDQILEGMQRSARFGTGKALGAGYLAKTGTAANAKWDGDGFLLAAWPAQSPQRIALFHWEGHTGAATAQAALPILRRWKLS